MKKNLKNGLAVRGYDLVSIVENKKAIKGKQSINLQYMGANYWFASKKNKQLFIENPEKYLPQYGGFCAIAMSEGALVDANPRSFLLQDDKLFVFFSKYFRCWRSKVFLFSCKEKFKKLNNTILNNFIVSIYDFIKSRKKIFK